MTTEPRPEFTRHDMHGDTLPRFTLMPSLRWSWVSPILQMKKLSSEWLSAHKISDHDRDQT